MLRNRARRSAALATCTAVLAALVISVMPPGASAAGVPTGDGSVRDANIMYFGRWDKTSASYYRANWAGAYLRVGFTGTTVKLQQRDTINLWASIDGGDFVRYNNVRGTVDLTTTPLPPGDHTLTVSYQQVAGNYTGDRKSTRLNS